MNASHVQTRTLTDALNRIDTILGSRGTRLRDVAVRRRLAECFAAQPAPEFQSWAFSAAEYEETLLAISTHAPQLLGRIQRPTSGRDFAVVGHCSLDLRFAADSNRAEPVPHTLCDGTRVEGARVTAASAVRYSSGLVSLPTIDGRAVYLLQPAERPEGDAAQIAAWSFANRGGVTHEGLSVTFPQARTADIPDYGWVPQLRSADGLYVVEAFVNSGEAILNENGFFARETNVVQMHYLCSVADRHLAAIDGPFVAFFADTTGVHAAAWFDRDSFSLYRGRRRAD